MQPVKIIMLVFVLSATINFAQNTDYLSTHNSTLLGPLDNSILSDPVLLSPTDQSTDQPLDITLKWDTSQRAVTYELSVYYKYPNGATTLTALAFSLKGLTSTSKEVNGLKPATKYQWRVAIYDNTGKIDSSGLWSFTTKSSTYTDEDNLKNKPDSYTLMQNYPNPFNPVTTINYSIPENRNVKLKVYDQLGKEISTIIDEFKSAGNYSAHFDGSNLPSGTYFYRLEAGEYMATKKLILMK